MNKTAYNLTNKTEEKLPSNLSDIFPSPPAYDYSKSASKKTDPPAFACLSSSREIKKL